MISRKTIFSLVLAMLIFLGIRVWVLNHRDPCDSYMPGHVLPGSVYIESGSQTVEMPCNLWLPRQPAWLQGICLLDLAVGVVFLLSVLWDWITWRRRRQGATG